MIKKLLIKYFLLHRTSFIYVIFNVVVCLVAMTFFIFQFTNTFQFAENYFPELMTMTAIYDKAKFEDDRLLKRIVPGLMYLVAILSCLITMMINIYTTSRVFRRHRNYVLGIGGLIVAVMLTLAPDFLVARLLDVRFVGPFVVCAITVELIGLVWVYGVKNVYTDLEFSIGRPILKLWLGIWIVTPVCLAGLLIWWMITTGTISGQELLITEVPRWVPVLISMGVIVIVSCVVVSKQVDYNFMAMIREANKPTKNWGPADPLVRHAWKQWTSKCEDTGERDFTLRRRGTKDYTNSIKRGQYPLHRYGTQTRNLSQGSNSPNYSGSVFGDSAIEEDISVDKFHGGYNHSNQHNNNKASTLTRVGGTGSGQAAIYSYSNERKSPKFAASNGAAGGGTLTRIAKEGNVYSGYLRGDVDQMYESNTLGRKIHLDAGNNFTSRIEILPQESANYNNNKVAVVRNPMARSLESSAENSFGSNRTVSAYQDNYNTFNIRNHQQQQLQQGGSISNGMGGGGPCSVSVSVIGNGGGGGNKRDSMNGGAGVASSHHCWRKYPGNSEEFSTEL